LEGGGRPAFSAIYIVPITATPEILNIVFCRTSENAPSRTFVNKGKEKGRSARIAPAPSQKPFGYESRSLMLPFFSLERVTDGARSRHLLSRATIRCDSLQCVLVRPVIGLIYGVLAALGRHAYPLRTSLY
jgi:hypothetical protein